MRDQHEDRVDEQAAEVGNDQTVNQSGDRYPEDPSERIAREFCEVFVRKLKESNVSEIVLAMTSIALMFIGAVQALIAYKSFQDTSPLVGYAKDNTAAAQKFADNAEKINIGVGHAVDRLDFQTRETEVVRQSSVKESQKALRAAIENAQSDRRAYLVVIPSIPSDLPGPCPSFIDKNRFCARVTYRNVGKTPAINIRITGHIAFGLVRETAIRELLVARYTGSEGLVLGVGDQAAILVTKDNLGQEPSFPEYLHGRTTGYFSYGLIQYMDLFRNHHETGFCIHYPQMGPPTSCDKYGNWFDIRPSGFVNEQR